nr:CHAD domain-containing protein [Actinomycetota bacterium]
MAPTPPRPGQHAVYTSSELRLVDLCRLLAQAGFDVGPTRPIRRSVLDTFDGRLYAAGLQLEFREVPEGELVLVGGGPIAARVAVERAPTFATDLPPGAFSARLASLLEVRALLPKPNRRGPLCRRAPGRRREGPGRRVVHGGLVVDETRIDTPACTAEVDAMEGYPKAAERASTLLSSLGLHRHSADMPGMLAEQAGVDLRGYAGSPTVALERDEAALDGFRRVLVNLADAMAANWAGTIDDVDSEFLHDLRVAVRRTRSVLSEAKRILPDDVRAHHRSEFRWLGTITSPARDLDVYLIEWDGYVEPLGPDVARALRPVVDHISGQRDIAHVALAEALRSDRYVQLMAGWRAWLTTADPEQLGREARRPLGAVAGRRIALAQPN